MKRVLKYVLLAVAVLLLGLIVTALVGLHFARGVPDFYRAFRWTAKERSAINQRAVNKLVAIKNLATERRAAELRLKNGRPADPTTLPSHVTVTFTEDELNAFIHHNAGIYRDLSDKISQYIAEPGIFFRDGCVILAGDLKDAGTIISLYFEPKIDEQGQLRLRLARTTAGRLSLPRSIVSAKFQKLEESIHTKLPQWKREAQLDDTGGANRSMAAAAMSELLLAALNDRPAPAVLFIPYDEQAKSLVPVRIVNVKIEKQSLTITLATMDRPEREKLFDEVTRHETTLAELARNDWRALHFLGRSSCSQNVPRSLAP